MMFGSSNYNDYVLPKVIALNFCFPSHTTLVSIEIDAEQFWADPTKKSFLTSQNIRQKLSESKLQLSYTTWTFLLG